MLLSVLHEKAWTHKLPSRLLGVCRDSLLDLRLDGLQVEARALLHRRGLARTLRDLADFVLYKLETPKLVGKPGVERQRTVGAVRKVHAFERVKTNVGQDRPIHLDRAAKPTAWLIGEAIFVIIDTHGRKRTFGEVEDLVASRRSLAGNQRRLVVTVQMDLVGPAAHLLALEELVRDVRIASSRDEGREPVHTREDTVFDLSRRY